MNPSRNKEEGLGGGAEKGEEDKVALKYIEGVGC